MEEQACLLGGLFMALVWIIFLLLTYEVWMQEHRPIAALQAASSAIKDSSSASSAVSDDHGAAATVTVAGAGNTEEFMPVEHPPEPPEKDQPVRCPPPEPSILHDGQIWKERLEATARRRSEFSGLHISQGQPQILQRRGQTFSNNHSIKPALSCPEHSIVKLLDECSDETKT